MGLHSDQRGECGILSKINFVPTKVLASDFRRYIWQEMESLKRIAGY